MISSTGKYGLENKYDAVRTPPDTYTYIVRPYCNQREERVEKVLLLKYQFHDISVVSYVYPIFSQI
jgi:hypothetical protein